MSELLNLVRHTLDEKLAENIVTIDIRNVNAYTDYYVICTAKILDTQILLWNLLKKK